MELKIGNTRKYLWSRTSFFILIILFFIGRFAMGSYGGSGWYTRNQNHAILISLLSVLFFIPIYYSFRIKKIIGNIKFEKQQLLITLFKTKNKIILAHEIISVNILFDNTNSKPIYHRTYFNGAENNWLIIKTKDDKQYKIEFLLESLKEEDELKRFLSELENKDIKITYGESKKSLFHKIRCLF